MFSNLTSFVQKAQQLIDPSILSSSSNSKPSPSSLFRHQFRLPDSQNPGQEILAELTLPRHGPVRIALNAEERERERSQGSRYSGRLFLSEAYICFSTQGSSFLDTATFSSSNSFNGQTHGTGPAENGFTLPLSAVRRVERLNSQSDNNIEWFQ